MQALSGNIGKEIKFFPYDKEGGRDALAIISLAEKKYAPPARDENGQLVWAEPETIWHNDVMITGKNATRFNDTFQPGDPIIIAGSYGKETQKELADGRIVTSTPFWVDTYGFDGTKVIPEIDRTPKQSQTSTPTQTVDQERHVTPEQQTQAEPVAEADLSAYDATAAMLEHRLTELVKTQRMSEASKQAVQTALSHSTSPEDAHLRVNTAVMQARLPATESAYLTSVTGELVGKGAALSWGEAERLQQPSTPQAPAPATAEQAYAQ